MPATTWTLTLQDRAAAKARRINRDVTALNASLRMLGQIAPSAQASLSRVAPAGTAGQIRGATAAIKEQTKALRELHKVANPTATPRPGRASGRGAGRTPNLGGRTRAEGRFGEMFTPRQSERLRGMGDANQRRWDRQRQQRDAAGSRSRLRDQQRETRESQNHYRGIFQSQQRAAAWGRQQNARAASTNARARAQARRDMTERSEMSSAMLGRAAGLAGMLGGIAASIVGTVVGIGTAFAGVASQIGMATLRLIAFREGALTTLRTLARGTGRGEQARQQLRDVQQFARETPQTQEQLIGAQTAITTAGFRGRQGQDILRATADVGSANPNDATAGDRFVYALGQVRSRGTLGADELRQLTQIGGVSREGIFENIARDRGMLRQGETMTPAMTRRIEAMISARQVTGEQGVNATLGSVRQNIDNGQELGTFARQQGGTLLGVLSNLDEAFFQFITSIEDIENLPGIKMLKGMLTQVANTLAGATPLGRELQAIFASVVNDVAMWVGMMGGKSGPTDFFRTILTTAREAWPVVQQLFSAFAGPFLAQLQTQLGGVVQTFGDAGLVGTLRMLIPYAAAFGSFLGRVVGFSIRATIAMGQFIAIAMRVAETMGAVLDGLLLPIQALFALVSGMFTGIGTAMTQGIVAGIQSGASSVWNEITGVANGAVNAVKDVLGIHSPSRVFADEVGWQIPAGIAMGARQGAGALDGAMAGLVPVPGVGGLGGGLGGGASISVVVQMVATGDPQADGETAGQAALDVILRAFDPLAFAGA